jgi:uncharacterized membrane protein YfcA
MSVPEAIAIAAAGFGAGTVNTVVGSGTLISFPVLLAFGYAPVQANVSNTVGLVPGGLSGTHGYRSELEGQRRRSVVLGTASVAGALIGAALLLTLPASAFKTIVPFFIGCALVLIVLQPWLSTRLEARRRRHRPHGGPWTAAGLVATGMYGGYFGAGQGILLLAVLGLALADSLQRVNALKNVLATHESPPRSSRVRRGRRVAAHRRGIDRRRHGGAQLGRRLPRRCSARHRGRRPRRNREAHRLGRGVHEPPAAEALEARGRPKHAAGSRR